MKVSSLSAFLTRRHDTVGNYQEGKEREGGNVAGIRKTNKEVPLSIGRPRRDFTQRPD